MPICDDLIDVLYLCLWMDVGMVTYMYVPSVIGMVRELDELGFRCDASNISISIASAYRKWRAPSVDVIVFDGIPTSSAENTRQFIERHQKRRPASVQRITRQMHHVYGIIIELRLAGRGARCHLHSPRNHSELAAKYLRYSASEMLDLLCIPLDLLRAAMGHAYGDGEDALIVLIGSHIGTRKCISCQLRRRIIASSMRRLRRGRWPVV